MSRHFRVQVRLLGTEPAVWRELELPAHLTLLGVHEVIFTAMGWRSATDFAFEIGMRRQATVNPDNLWQVGERLDATLADLLSRSGQPLHYIHDLEVLWDHEIELVEVVEREGDSPCCVNGQGACPPDDAGGPATYRHLLEALAHPSHREHHKAQAVLGADFNPQGFDLEHTSQALAAAAHEDWLEHDAPFADDLDDIEPALAKAYDADRGPDVGLWLALNQADMIAAVEYFHLRQHLRRRSEALRSHAVLHMAIETQVAEGQPPEAQQALRRLQKQGVDRHEAIHALGSVLSSHLGKALQTDRFDDEAYAGALAVMDATTWRREMGLGLIPAVMKRGIRRHGKARRRTGEPIT
ncbi:MAG: DUF1841 family protein [Pseudomonadota bacterium]